MKYLLLLIFLTNSAFAGIATSGSSKYKSKKTNGGGSLGGISVQPSPLKLNCTTDDQNIIEELGYLSFGNSQEDFLKKIRFEECVAELGNHECGFSGFPFIVGLQSKVIREGGNLSQFNVQTNNKREIIFEFTPENQKQRFLVLSKRGKKAVAGDKRSVGKVKLTIRLIKNLGVLEVLNAEHMPTKTELDSFSFKCGVGYPLKSKFEDFQAIITK